MIDIQYKGKQPMYQGQTSIIQDTNQPIQNTSRISTPKMQSSTP